MSRQSSNKEIVNEISKVIEKYPDLRFHQILQILNIVELDKKVFSEGNPHEIIEQLSTDKFNEESDKTLERVFNSKQAV